MNVRLRHGAALQAIPIQRRAMLVVFLVVAALAIAGLAGCSSKSPFAGKGSPKYDGPDPIPRGGGVYKVGNPYKIAGRTYYPREDPDYDETGTASWYGEAFHRRQTANGEWYDMNALTAAHPTLPLPSYVRVTNQKNGRSLVVRVNDRGPYAPDRIIDMSKRSAKVLGFQNDGLTRVRVQYLGRAPLDYEDADIEAMNRRYRTRGRPQTLARTDRLERPVETGSVDQPRQGLEARYYVQAAAFSSRENAERLRRDLGRVGQVAVDELTVGSSTYYRVRLGPLHDESTANRMLRQVRDAGQRDAHIIAN